MEEQKKSIFRQKSLERISSPEELDQYLQVTKPATWIVLAAVVVLLFGFLTWGFLGHLTSRLPVAVMVENGKAICYVPDSQSKEIEAKEIRIGKESYRMIRTGLEKKMVDETTPSDIKEFGHLENGDVVRCYSLNGNLADGYYQGEIIIENVTPIHFIIN